MQKKEKLPEPPRFEQKPAVIEEPKKEKRPEPPRFSQSKTIESAIASTVEKLTSDEDQAVAVLANLHPSDASRLSILASVQKSYTFDWLKDYTKSFETYSAAIDGKRSDQITEIAKPPAMASPEESFFQRLKGKVF